MITLADARRVIAAAERKAEEIGQPMNIAVVDAGQGLDWKRRYRHQEGLDLAGVRYLDQRTCRLLAIGR